MLHCDHCSSRCVRGTVFRGRKMEKQRCQHGSCSTSCLFLLHHKSTGRYELMCLINTTLPPIMSSSIHVCNLNFSSHLLPSSPLNPSALPAELELITRVGDILNLKSFHFSAIQEIVYPAGSECRWRDGEIGQRSERHGRKC